MPLPRYFVASTGGESTEPIWTEVSQALDAFVVETGAGRQEWVVGLDDRGLLTAQTVEPRGRLRPAVQSQLAFHEAAGRACRVLPLESLYLFEAHALAHAPDLPGVNDPLLVHGTLVGPIGDSDGKRISGQLTVTRADILHGLADSAGAAFLHADRLTVKVARSFHALLPGDREESLRQGHGVVLAYPLLAGEAALLAGPGNEAVVDEMLYRVLKAVWRDVARESPPPERHPDDLPVPSRSAHEWKLMSQGFTISGNRAVRKKKGRLRSFFGAERRRLPPQGHTDLFLQLAQEALRLLPLHPLRINALGARVPRRQPPVQSREAAWAASVEGREHWIQRFIDAQDQRRREGGGGSEEGDG